MTPQPTAPTVNPRRPGRPSRWDLLPPIRRIAFLEKWLADLDSTARDTTVASWIRAELDSLTRDLTPSEGTAS